MKESFDMVSELPVRVRVQMALRTIEPQFRRGKLMTGEERLCFAVVRQAINDGFSYIKGDKTECLGALHYLCGRIPHAELCGCDSEWIRSVLVKLNLSPKKEIAHMTPCVRS